MVATKLPKTLAARRPAVEALGRKWGPIFGCPLDIFLTITKIESAWRPSPGGIGLTDPRALARGGAFGLGQQTLLTARGHAAAIRLYKEPIVIQTLARWDGTGRGLEDPEINAMFTAYHLGKLVKEFGPGRLDLIATGYHQGTGTARKVAGSANVQGALAALGKPKGATYVAMAAKAHKELYG